MLVRKVALSIGAGIVIAALSAASAFAAEGPPGASLCQPAQGQITATVAQTGQLGNIITHLLVPINQLNQQSLFHCNG